jgi:beta-1,4-mannosyltransferase
MLRVFFYGRIGFEDAEDPNPYISDLVNSLSQNFEIANKKDYKIGVLGLFRYLFRADIFYLNWIENIPNNRFGSLQSLAFFLFLLLTKVLGKKTVWTLHNKYSHDQKRNYWIDLIFKTMIKYSDLVLTHSQVGLDFINEEYPGHSSKAVYIIHPVAEALPIEPDSEKKYDFLIWGSVQPYKGIVEFLKFVNGSPDMQSLKILIVGKCFDKDYKKEIDKYLSGNVIYLDEFYELKDISVFASQSKFILFPYKTESILSSGSLIDSIRMHACIIGPNDGAFKDLSIYSFIHTYNSFEEIITIHKNCKSSPVLYYNQIDKFCEDNSWDRFAGKFEKALSGKA